MAALRRLIQLITRLTVIVIIVCGVWFILYYNSSPVEQPPQDEPLLQIQSPQTLERAVDSSKTDLKFHDPATRNPKREIAMKALANINAQNRPELLDPFTHEIDDTVECLPLPSALNREKLCSYDPEDDVFISAVLRKGEVWEGANVEAVRYLMEQNPDFGLLDIGTNLGVYAVTFGSMKRNYVGVECFPPTLNILSRTLRMNPHLLTHVLVVSSAISDNYDPVDFYARPDIPHPGAIETHSKDDVAQNGQPYQHTKAEKIGSARAVLMDDLIPIIPFKRAIVKMDIEDGESKALAGAYKIFKEIDMTHIMMEWAVKWWKRPKDAKFIIQFMEEHGYTVHEHVRPFKELELSYEASKKWPFDIMWIKKETAKTLT